MHAVQDGIPPLQPTHADIASVIRPWRTVEQRGLATDPGLVGSVWLRTCYKEGTDEKHKILVEEIQMDHAVDREERLLDDATLYNFGNHWERILDYVPELVGPLTTSFGYDFTTTFWDSYLDSIRKAKDEFCKAREILSGGSTEGATAMTIELIESSRRDLQADLVMNSVLEVTLSYLHKMYVVNYLIVEDEEALESGLLLIIFLDAFGRVVRHCRMDASLAESMGGSWLECCWDESSEWVEGTLGEDYQEGGACGDLVNYNSGAT